MSKQPNQFVCPEHNDVICTLYGNRADCAICGDPMTKLPKMKKQPSLDDADHPIRHAAIHIIETVIEPALKKGVSGQRYYTMEDKIVDIVAEHIAHPHNPPKPRKHLITIEVEGGCVTDVRGLPEGWLYELDDHDV